MRQNGHRSRAGRLLRGVQRVSATRAFARLAPPVLPAADYQARVAREIRLFRLHRR
ncbi:hypothetical protein GCM10009535_16460 [Streptomyces thermocarboxydovorans]|uniref:Uncharacterized protein n=1 Tax=Streptomyces thermocarboxydovorans TaxID=59298 RepID=A0ABP3SK54_9ACTN